MLPISHSRELTECGRDPGTYKYIEEVKVRLWGIEFVSGISEL